MLRVKVRVREVQSVGNQERGRMKFLAVAPLAIIVLEVTKSKYIATLLETGNYLHGELAGFKCN